MNRSLSPLVSILCIALLMSASGKAMAQKGDVSAHPMIGDAAPAFELESTSGETHSLEGWKGKFIVLHFGASW
jgi:cytochrome oxidase Cu insertion factor (SCO1/SenC/PrrC family)